MRPLSKIIPEILQANYGVAFDQAQPSEMRKAVEDLMNRDGVEVARSKLRSLNKHLRKHRRTPVSFEQGHPLFWAAYLDGGHPEDKYIPPPIITGAGLGNFLGRRGWAEWRLAAFADITPSLITRMVFDGQEISPMLSALVWHMIGNDILRGSPNSDQRPEAILSAREVVSYRESRLLYQRHMAARTGYSVRTVRHMELGEHAVSQVYSSTIRVMMENDELAAQRAA
jgi:hypothetical protein